MLMLMMLMLMLMWKLSFIRVSGRLRLSEWEPELDRELHLQWKLQKEKQKAWTPSE